MSLALAFGVLSFLFNFIGSVRYIRDVAKGITHPHIFTWLVWTLLDLIGTALQVNDGSWGSAFSIGTSTLLVGSVFLLGLRQGDKDITRSDWLALSAAVFVIPIWLMTREPLFAAVLISLINIAGCWPTYRKAWGKPEEENLFSFSFFTLFALFCVLAVSPFTMAAGLYPVAILLLNGGVAAVIVFRRQAKCARKNQARGSFR